MAILAMTNIFFHDSNIFWKRLSVFTRESFGWNVAAGGIREPDTSIFPSKSCTYNHKTNYKDLQSFSIKLKFKIFLSFFLKASGSFSNWRYFKVFSLTYYTIRPFFSQINRTISLLNWCLLSEKTASLWDINIPTICIRCLFLFSLAEKKLKLNKTAPREKIAAKVMLYF